MAIQRTFLGSLALLLFLNLLVKPAWILGIDLGVQNLLGPGQYGLYFSLYNFSLLFNVVLDLGLTLNQNRMVARNEEVLRSRFLGLAVLKIMLGLVYLAINAAALQWVGYSQELFVLGLVLAFNQVMGSLILYFRANLSGLHLYKLDAVVSVVDKVLLVVVCGILLYVPAFRKHFTMATFVYAQTATYVLGAAVAFGLVFWHGKPTWQPVRKKFVLGALKESWPFAFLVFLMSVYNRVDGVMVERMAGAVEGGIYAAGFRLLDAFNQVGFLFSMLLLPMFSKLLTKREELLPLVRLSTQLMVVGTVGVGVICWFFAEPIVGMLYEHRLAESAQTFKWLMPGAIAFGLNYIYGSLLTADGKMGWLNSIAFVGFGMNLLLNARWIPDHGAEGAAWATLITQGGTALLQAVVAHVKYRIDWSSRQLKGIGISVLGWLVFGWFSVQLPVGWGIQLAIALSGGILAVAVSGLVRPGQLKMMLNGKLGEAIEQN